MPSLKKFLVYGGLYLFTFFIFYSLFILTPYDDGQRLWWLRLIIVICASILLAKYMLYMVVSPWYDVWVYWRYGDERDRKYYPKVSVLVPAWNEEVGILTTVQSLLKSTYRNLELVIVNDGSTDNSDAIIREFVRRYYAALSSEHQAHHGNVSIVYKYQKNQGKGGALNTALGLASGEIIMSIDGDCLVDKHAVANFVKYFRDPHVSAAVGNVKIGNTETILGTIQSLEFLFSFYFKKADSLMNAIYIIGGAAGAFRREVFDKVGTYATHNITEDIDLSIRIQNAGMKIVYAADAIVYTEGATELAALIKQRLRWKSGRFKTFQDYRSLFFSLRRQHNKILTCFILPLAIFGDIQLSLELFFLAFLYIYSFLMQDFSSFISGIVVVSSMFFFQVFDDARPRTFWFILLFPIGWLLFYVSTWVECVALAKSLWSFYTHREVRWQRWQRTGVAGAATAPQLVPTKVSLSIHKL